MYNVLLVAELERFTDVDTEFDDLFFIEPALHHTIEKRCEKLHPDQDIVTYTVLMWDDLVILIADDVAVALELGHDLVLVDDLFQDALVVFGDILYIRSSGHPGFDIIIVLRHADDLERGPVCSAILFSAYLKDLAKAALAY